MGEKSAMDKLIVGKWSKKWCLKVILFDFALWQVTQISKLAGPRPQYLEKNQ